MKIIDVYEKYKSNYNKSVIFIKNGIFYNVLNDDVSILFFLFKYKIKNNGTNYMIGFPEKNIVKVCDNLKKNSINFIVLDENNEIILKNKTNKNVYDKYRMDIFKLDYFNKKLNNIYDNLKVRLNDSNIENILNTVEGIVAG